MFDEDAQKRGDFSPVLSSTEKILFFRNYPRVQPPTPDYATRKKWGGRLTGCWSLSRVFFFPFETRNGSCEILILVNVCVCGERRTRVCCCVGGGAFKKGHCALVFDGFFSILRVFFDARKFAFLMHEGRLIGNPSFPFRFAAQRTLFSSIGLFCVSIRNSRCSLVFEFEKIGLFSLKALIFVFRFRCFVR